MSGEKSDSAQADPFALWRQWYEASEKAWGKAAADATDSEAYAALQGRMLESYLAFQKTARDMATAQLETMNIASRDDVSRLGELILGLEEKIDQLADRVAVSRATSRTAAPAAGVPAKGVPARGVPTKGVPASPRSARR